MSQNSAPESEPAPAPPVTQERSFWVLMAYAAGLGVFGALAALVFLGVVKLGGKWYDDTNPGWLGGHWWWIAVTAAAGVVVGLLRIVTRLPEQTPGLIEDLRDQHVSPRLVPGIVAVSAASLIGGASLGPEKALGTAGGGAASLIASRRGLSKENSQLSTLSGFAGAYGGMFSSTVIVVMLLLEVVRPGGRKFTKALAGMIVASSVSFGVYFAIAGAVFLGAYKVPSFKFEDWQLGAAIPLGLFAAIVVTLLGAIVMASARLFARLKVPAIAKSAIGGLLFGLLGVALPLTLFTGSNQLKTLLQHAGTLGLGLLVATLIGKLITFAVSQGGGFVGGPIFPSLFMGGTAGVIVHQVIPGIPLGLAFACLLAAVPGSLVSAPFTFVLLAAFVTQVGALQTAPVLIAVITGFLAVEGIKYLVALRKRAREQPPRPAAGP